MFILVWYLELIIIGRFVYGFGYSLPLFFYIYLYIYIYFFPPFSLFVSVYIYASLCDFVCIGFLLPFVLVFCLSFFFF